MRILHLPVLAAGLALLGLTACETTAPNTPEIARVAATAPPSANTLVGINVTAARPVQNVRVSTAGKTYPPSPSGAVYLRLAPGTHTITVNYDVFQADGTLAARSTRQNIAVPNTIQPITSTIFLP